MSLARRYTEMEETSPRVLLREVPPATLREHKTAFSRWYHFGALLALGSVVVTTLILGHLFSYAGADAEAMGFTGWAAHAMQYDFTVWGHLLVLGFFLYAALGVTTLLFGVHNAEKAKPE